MALSSLTTPSHSFKRYPGKISSCPASSALKSDEIVQMMTTFYTHGVPRSLLSSPSADLRTQLSLTWQVLSSFNMTDPPEERPHVSSFANPLTFSFQPLGHSISVIPQVYALRRNCFASVTACHLERLILLGDEVPATCFRDHVIASLLWTYFTRGLDGLCIRGIFGVYTGSTFLHFPASSQIGSLPVGRILLKYIHLPVLSSPQYSASLIISYFRYPLFLT